MYRDNDKLGTASWGVSKIVASQFKYREGMFCLGKEPTIGTLLGYCDDRHILTVAGTRAGKGTSFIIPNLMKWRGSVFVVDPTGDTASITASHRARTTNGSVHVLDPYNVANVEEALRGAFNPLEDLDLDSPHIVRDVNGIVSSLISEDDPYPAWARDGAHRLLTGLVLLVLVDSNYEGKRNLATVRDLIFRGDLAAHQYVLKKHNTKIPPIDLMLRAMVVNESFNGEIAGVGEEFRDMKRNAQKQWTGVRDAALECTKFINNPSMRECLSSSTFKLEDLKTKKEPTSVYLSIPSKSMDVDFRWLRLMVNVALNRLESTPQRKSVSGHSVLFVLDEFSALRKMNRIEGAISQIAKFDIKLYMILQSLAQLKKNYEDGWETFVANSGTKIYFSIDDQFTREYISKAIGETELTKVTNSSSLGKSKAKTITSTKGESESNQISKGEGKSNSFKPWVLGIRKTAGSFKKITGNREVSDSYQTSSTKGKTLDSSKSHGTSETSDSSSSKSEAIHTRPLVTPDEVGKYFRRVNEKGDPHYPGLALCLISDFPDPILIQRINYFDAEECTEDDLESAIPSLEHVKRIQENNIKLRVRDLFGRKSFFVAAALFFGVVYAASRISDMSPSSRYEPPDFVYSDQKPDMYWEHFNEYNGNQYKGGLLDEEPHGRGMMKYPDGSGYQGQWFEGHRDTSIHIIGDQYSNSDKSIMQYADGALYLGGWKKGKKYGRGTMYYSDGSFYEGEWLDGARHGNGSQHNIDGSIQRGAWRDDHYRGGEKAASPVVVNFVEGGEFIGDVDIKLGKIVYDDGRLYIGRCNFAYVPDGVGTMTYPNGMKYSGIWNSGNFDDFGRITFPDGAIYIGPFDGGVRDSFGMFSFGDIYPSLMAFPNGDIFKGSWLNDKITRGSMAFANGDTYEGVWKNGQPAGFGRLDSSSGQTFEGSWEVGKAKGKGKLTLVDGHLFDGDWVDGLPQGRGAFVFSGGDTLTGNWINGKLSGKATYVSATGEVVRQTWNLGFKVEGETINVGNENFANFTTAVVVPMRVKDGFMQRGVVRSGVKSEFEQMFFDE